MIMVGKLDTKDLTEFLLKMKEEYAKADLLLGIKKLCQ